MIGELSGLGVSVPGGYATTADAFKRFIAHNNLEQRIFDKLATLDVEDVAALNRAGTEIRAWVIDAFRGRVYETAVFNLPATSGGITNGRLPAGAAQAQISGNVVKIGILNDQSSLYADLGGQGSVTAAQMAIDDFGAGFCNFSCPPVLGSSTKTSLPARRPLLVTVTLTERSAFPVIVF